MMLLKKTYNAKINNIKDTIPDVTNWTANTTLNAKMNEVKNKIPSITTLATNVSSSLSHLPIISSRII